MIIFGTRGITYSKNKGEFHCPSCGAGDFKHKRVRRFFTLYFIPLIPLGLLGEYVECNACKSTYDLAVLDYDPGAENAVFEAAFVVAIKRIMVLMCLADGIIDPDEIGTMARIHEQLTGSSITEAALQLEIDKAEREAKGIQDYLQSVVSGLNDAGKESIVKAAYLVAAADGEIHPEERRLLAEIAETLQLTSAHFKGILASVEESLA